MHQRTPEGQSLSDATAAQRSWWPRRMKRSPYHYLQSPRLGSSVLHLHFQPYRCSSSLSESGCNHLEGSLRRSQLTSRCTRDRSRLALVLRSRFRVLLTRSGFASQSQRSLAVPSLSARSLQLKSLQNRGLLCSPNCLHPLSVADIHQDLLR